MKVGFCLGSIRQSPGQSKRSAIDRREVLETLGFWFAGEAVPIHCPLMTTYCSKVVCIATRMEYDRLRRIVNVDHIHDSSIEGNCRRQKYLPNIGLWNDASRSWRCGSLKI